jgi:hypothetical protein
MTKRLLYPAIMILISFWCISGYISAQPYYVALNGSDSNPGTIGGPFLTIEKAVSKVQPGQTIYVRGGTYDLTAVIVITKSGTENSLITLAGYTGERPVLNFSGQLLGGSNRGINLTGSYWHFLDIDITGAGDNGMRIEGGSYNTIENCAFYRNRDSGLQFDSGASNNRVLNCDSYFNADPTDYADADGFAVKLTVGSGNYFYGCRAWKNCDDGWDGYLRGADDVSTTVESCWAFENGYLEDGTDPGAQANGNGFKMGGSDDKTLMHNFTLKNCLAFKNKAKGFDQNNNKGSMILYNCTGHNNLVADYRITQVLATGKILVVKNCAELGTKVEIGSFAEQEKNSWLPSFVVTADDFRSTDATGADGPRKADGSLPHIEYLHLAPGSDLIDAGVNVGLPFMGTAPDLGCFETGLTGINDINTHAEVICYPNPIGDRGFLEFTIDKGGRCEVRLFDITGKHVKTLSDEMLGPGRQHVSIDLSGVRNGLYICQIRMNEMPLLVTRIVKTGQGR